MIFSLFGRVSVFKIQTCGLNRNISQKKIVLSLANLKRKLYNSRV